MSTIFQHLHLNMPAVKYGIFLQQYNCDIYATFPLLSTKNTQVMFCMNPTMSKS